MVQPHDLGHGFAMLTNIDSRLLHHLIFKSNFFMILLVTYFIFFLILSFNIGLLKIKLHSFFYMNH